MVPLFRQATGLFSVTESSESGGGGGGRRVGKGSLGSRRLRHRESMGKAV